MKTLIKKTAILLSLSLILQSSAVVADSVNNKREIISNLNSNQIIFESTKYSTIESTTSSSASYDETINLSSEVTTSAAVDYNIDTLQKKINDVVAKVETDQKSGIVYAQENLSDLYLDSAQTSNSLNNFQLIIDAAKQLIAEGSTNTDAIKTAYDAIDTAYNSLRKIETYSSFSGVQGTVWKDTNGVAIQAHGGQVQWLEKEGKWWWYGEDKTKGYRSNGISAYSSDDLYNWKFEGYVMRTVSSRDLLDSDPYFSKLYKGYTREEKDNVYLCINNSTSVIERPKVIYNKKNKQYVMWFHADGPTEASPNSNYAAASAGVAVSDSPNGPFKFINRYRLNVCPEKEKTGEWYESSAGFARDMNLFVDDDDTAYIVYSSEENRTMFISKLDDDYTYLANDVDNANEGEDFVRLFPGAQREAPALFKYNKKYYLITSGATGWNPNAAQYWVADKILGKWTNMGDPCIGDTNKNTFKTQSTNVTAVNKNAGKFIFMSDRWNSSNLADSRYVWLPVEIDINGKLTLESYNNWTLDSLNKLNNTRLKTKLNDLYTNVDELPKSVKIQVYENNKWVDKSANVTWNVSGVTPLTQTTVTGVLDSQNEKISVNFMSIPENLEYYIDCGNTTSTTYDIISKQVKLTNKVCDQAYTDGSFGYLGTIGVDINYKNKDSSDSLNCGFWAYKDKTIDYKIPIKAGSHSLFAGFNEWWNAYRTMGITISYKDTNGQTVKKDFGTFTNSGVKTVNYDFDLPVDSDVTISVYKPNTNNPDVILSWLAIK